MFPEWWKPPGNLCGLVLPHVVSVRDATAILVEMGCVVRKRDPVAEARRHVGTSAYRFMAHPEEAPNVVNCATFVKYVFSCLGILLPRLAVLQRDMGQQVDLSGARRGDLVFAQGPRPYYIDDPDDGVGHVGIVAGEGTVIHASKNGGHGGVLESPLSDLTGKTFRGIRRVVEDWERFVVVELPPDAGIEHSGEVLCKILSRL